MTDRRFTPKGVVKDYYGEADRLSNQRWAPNLAGILAAGLGGVGGNVYRGAARTAQRDNQGMRSDALRTAGDAPDNMSMSRALLDSGVPGLDEMGLKTTINTRNKQADRSHSEKMDAQKYDRGAPMRDARLELLQAQTANAQRGAVVDPLAQQVKAAQLKKLQQGNAMDAVINRMISGGAQPNAQAGQPQLQNQSFNAAPQPHAGVHLTAGGAAPQGQQPQPAEQMVQTPMGPMPASKARHLGMALALRGKGAAGKMFTNPINQQNLSKTATNQNDTRHLNSIEALGRLDEITDLTDERFLTIDSKVKNYGMSWLDSFGPLRDSISPEDRKELEDFTKFRRSAVDNINRYIKEITGAQMSEAEASRLRKAAPDAEKDSPTQFMSKLSDIKKTTRLGIIRYSYLRKNGFNGSAKQASKQLPLQQMGNIVKEARQKALQQINTQSPSLPEDQKNEMVRKLMLQDLGVNT